MNEPAFRTSTIGYFESLTDKEERRMMGAIEAFCGWFDDLVLTELTEKQKRENFTEQEFQSIIAFHQYFESISDRFDVEREWEVIESDQEWIELIERAKHTLESLARKTEPAASGQRR